MQPDTLIAEMRFGKVFSIKPRCFRTNRRKVRAKSGGKGVYTVLCKTCLICDDESNYPEHASADIYFTSGNGKGAGKKGKGNFEKKNLIRNGKPLTCFHCGSDTHLAANCPMKRTQQHLAQLHTNPAYRNSPATGPPIKTPGSATSPNAPQPQMTGYGAAFTSLNGPPMASSWHQYENPQAVLTLADSSKSKTKGALTAIQDQAVSTKQVRFETPCKEFFFFYGF